MVLLYSNDETKELGTDEEILQMFKECTDWEAEHPNGEEPSYNELRNWIDGTLQMYCDDFFDQVPDMKCVLRGTAGLWNGPREGGKVDKLYNLLTQAQEDYNTYELDEKTGTIHITAIHHDGTNHWEVKALSKKGLDYYERNENHYNLSDRDIVEKLWNTKEYTKRIKIWM